jgi:hypothetical protein
LPFGSDKEVGTRADLIIGCLALGAINMSDDANLYKRFFKVNTLEELQNIPIREFMEGLTHDITQSSGNVAAFTALLEYEVQTLNNDLIDTPHVEKLKEIFDLISVLHSYNKKLLDIAFFLKELNQANKF